MAVVDNNLESVTAALQSTRVSPSGVSFAGESLILNSADDAKVITDEINKCTDLQFLNLEGNTLGVEAAESVGKALETHPEFKRALWMDLFTGRIKTEIPKALQFLGAGLVTAGARLVELNMSDNAFGPIGVEGLAALLRSSSCYALEELRLNNNGLGVTGGKLLAAALTDCYNASKSEGKPLALKIFTAGRNRLENEGAKALAQVFQKLRTLEEIAMPQNGIYHVGISALSEAFTHNKNLQILDLNDNTIGEMGARAIASALPNLQQLKQINFGDCLLKTKGAISLAKALKGSHSSLEEVIMGSNEIRKEGGLEIASAMSNKAKMKSLILDGNMFGEQGKAELEKKLKEIGKFHILGPLEANESEDEEEQEWEVEDEYNETEGDVTEYREENDSVEITRNGSELRTVQEFFNTPSPDNFMMIGDDRDVAILEEIQPNLYNLEDIVKRLMQVSALSNNLRQDVARFSLKITKEVYNKLFTWAQSTSFTPVIINYILVYLGLIKSETKGFRITWNLEGCFHALKNVLSEDFIPENMKDALKSLLQKDIDNNGDLLPLKKEILDNLN